MIKITVSLTSLLLFFLFFFWGTAHNPLLPFSVFYPQFHFIAGTTLIAIMILGRDSASFQPLFRFFETHRYKIFPTFAIISGIAINVYIFDNIPHVQDGIHYKYMAEVFAHGNLAQSMPVHYEFFNYPFFMVDGNRHFSLFMPGYPFLLIPFALIGVTFLANPILTGVNVLMIGRTAQALFGSTTSTYSMFLFVVSPFMMTMSGTWMPHPFAATLTILAVYSFVRFSETGLYYFPVAAGLSIGWLILTRPQNALFFTILFIAIGLLKLNSFDFIKTAVLFAIPLIAATGILLAYNHNFTGSPTSFIQDVYFNISEPVNHGHRIGLGTGCYHCNGESLPIGGMTWQHGVTVTKERVAPLLMETFPHPLFFIFVIASLIMTINDPSDRRSILLLIALFLVPLLGYFLFYFHGNVYGPRYLYEGAAFLIIVAASGIVFTMKLISTSGKRFGGSVVYAFIVSSIVYELFFLIPQISTVYGRGFWGIDSQMKESIEFGKFEKSVFFVSIINEMSYGNGLVSMDLWRLEDNDNIFVRDLGDESNAKYMHFKKSWNYFRVRYNPWSEELIRPKRIYPVLNEDVIHVEMEDKFLPYLTRKGYPDYCNVYPVQNHIIPHVEFSENLGFDFSRKQSLYCRFVNATQGYTFGQYFSSGGVYTVTLSAVSGPEFGDLSIVVDDEEVALIDLHGEDSTQLNDFCFEIEVTEGLHTIRISPRRNTLGARTYFMIDFIRFEKILNAK